jgi:chromosome segregation ATPase
MNNAPDNRKRDIILFFMFVGFAYIKTYAKPTNMKNSIISLFLLSGALFSCDFNNEREKFKAKSDSLESVLLVTMRAVDALEDVGIMMDSIDKNRNAIRLDMREGLQYDEYVSRMKNLNDYVKKSEAKIAQLEKDLSATKHSNSAYVYSISKYKTEIAKKNKDILELQSLVEEFKSANSELLSLVELKESKLADAEIEILQKRQELALLESRIQELMIQSKMTEADAYYARAAAVEEAAKRTKLAPKKKKDTLREALELYKKSKEKGREDAQAKIDELEGILN